MPDEPATKLSTDIATAINSAQREYRTYFEACIKAHRHQEAFVPELLILVNGPPDIPEKHRLWRCDAIWKREGQPQPAQFELGSPTPFTPFTELHQSGIRVTMHPTVWHRCEFYFKAREDAWSSVDLWQTRWLDQGDTKPRDKFGLAGVIHWLSEPSRDGDQFSFVVDFGSAPPLAFHELLSALGDSGAKEITVASFGHSIGVEA